MIFLQNFEGIFCSIWSLRSFLFLIVCTWLVVFFLLVISSFCPIILKFHGDIPWCGCIFIHGFRHSTSPVILVTCPLVLELLFCCSFSPRSPPPRPIFYVFSFWNLVWILDNLYWFSSSPTFSLLFIAFPFFVFVLTLSQRFPQPYLPPLL